MERTLPLLKALADESRLKIVKLLLQYNYCVGALARELQLTDAAVSSILRCCGKRDWSQAQRRASTPTTL